MKFGQRPRGDAGPFSFRSVLALRRARAGVVGQQASSSTGSWAQKIRDLVSVGALELAETLLIVGPGGIVGAHRLLEEI